MTDFSAKASTLGSLHQVRYSLVLILDSEEATLQLEGLDDVDIDAPGEPGKLLQLKHRAPGTVLTDLDPDLWKTIRIWAEHVAAGRVNPQSTVFALATTATAGAGSAPELLRPGSGRDVSAAMKLLDDAAEDSTNQGLKKAFDAYGALGSSQKQLLLDRVFVLDESPTIAESRVVLEANLGPTVRREHRAPLADRLEGWWLDQCVKLLRNQRAPIRGFEVFEKAQLVAEQFRPDALPIDYFDARPSSSEETELFRRQFVEQLRVLDISAKRVANAVHDYYRAFVQRTRWATDQLLIGDEIEKYEAALKEEWERVRDALVDELGAEPTEEELQKLGATILRWAELEADVRIRADVRTPYVLRGSFHILADASPPRVWWHPEFMNRLEEIMESNS